MFVYYRNVRTRDPAKEAAIRRKALTLIVKHGFDGLSMHKLAKEAKVSPATIYIYFRDREDLLLSVFVEENGKMMESTLKGFHPEMAFAEGLKVQWRNRAHYFLQNPQSMHFLEQVRYSPLHEKAMKCSGEAFRVAMHTFVRNAIRKGELVEIPVEVYWSLAFAPLYQLVKFDMHGSGFFNRQKFTLDETVLDMTLSRVLKSLTPE